MGENFEKICGFDRCVALDIQPHLAVKLRKLKAFSTLCVGHHELLKFNFPFGIEEYKREVFVMNHVEFHCGGNRCAYISLYKQVGTSVVRHCDC